MLEKSISTMKSVGGVTKTTVAMSEKKEGEEKNTSSGFKRKVTDCCFNAYINIIYHLREFHRHVIHPALRTLP